MAFFNAPGLTLTSEGRQVTQKLKELEGITLKFGFQAGEDPYEDGTELTTIAAANELGGSNRPARPFMRQSWENHEDELKQMCERGLKIIYGGGSVEQACASIGVGGVGLIQREIVEGGFAPNAPATIARKGSDTPLIDTAHMRQSVRFKVEKGE